MLARIKGIFSSKAYQIGQGGDGSILAIPGSDKILKQFSGDYETAKRSALAEFYLGEFALRKGINVPKKYNILAPNTKGRLLYPGDSNTWAVVMRYIDGLTMREIPEEMGTLVAHVTRKRDEQLAIAKALGIDVKRDAIRPENVMFGKDREVYLLDQARWEMSLKDYRR